MYFAAIVVQAWWRGILARRRAQRRRQAADTIRRYAPADGTIHSLCDTYTLHSESKCVPTCGFKLSITYRNTSCRCPTLRFIKGFIYRHKERCPENEYFLDYVRYSFLMKLRRNLPKNVLDKSWPTPPAALTEVRQYNTDRTRLSERWKVYVKETTDDVLKSLVLIFSLLF